MSITEPQEPIRLAPLMGTSSGTPRPIQDCNHVLELAINGNARLYVAVPPDDVAYVSNSEPVIGSVDGNAPGLRHWDKIDESERIRREMKFLALDPSQSERLRAKKIIDVDRFPCGLAPHPNDELLQQGGMELRQFTSALCLCSTKQADAGNIPPTPNMLDVPETYSLIWPRQSVKIEYHDVYIDERVLTLVENLETSNQDDPYHLHDRSPGVYVLYCAAARYYDPRKHGTATREQIKAWVIERLPELYRDTISNHAVKLIDPKYRRGSGIKPKNKKVFDPAVLSDEKFRGKYKASFINQSLALILHVTHWWLEESAHFKESKLKKKPTRLDVENKLDEIGFYKREREALTRIVMWPDQ
jgi:hypothetical protein